MVATKLWNQGNREEISVNVFLCQEKLRKFTKCIHFHN